MDWLNEGVGLIVLIASVIIVLLLAVALTLLCILRSKIAVQRLKFLGFYSTDKETRERFAECTLGNPSLNEVAVTEIGISNGKVTFNLTDLYKKKANLTKEARVVIEQRSSIRFTLDEKELMTLLLDGKNGKELKPLRLYAVDLTGNLYRGKIKPVQKLLAELLAESLGKKPRPEALPASHPASLPSPDAAPHADVNSHANPTHETEETNTETSNHA